MLGVKSRTTVNRYLTGERTPAPSILTAIMELTDGAVTPADFETSGPPACAIAIHSADGESRLVFPWSRGWAQEAAFQRMLAEPKEGDRLSEPLRLAMESLGPRAAFTRRGRFLLDGRASDARRIVAAANRVRAEQGRPPIRYPAMKRPDHD